MGARRRANLDWRFDTVRSLSPLDPQITKSQIHLPTPHFVAVGVSVVRLGFAARSVDRAFDPRLTRPVIGTITTLAASCDAGHLTILGYDQMLRFLRAHRVIVGAAEADRESILLDRARTIAGQVGKFPEFLVRAAAHPIGGLGREDDAQLAPRVANLA